MSAAAAVPARLPSRSLRSSAPRTMTVQRNDPASTRYAEILARVDLTLFAMSSITNRYVRVRWDMTEIRILPARKVEYSRLF